MKSQKKRAELYTMIVEELPQMRRETVQLVRQAVSQAPLTMQALSEMLRE